jgi:hypothetical protein
MHTHLVVEAQVLLFQAGGAPQTLRHIICGIIALSLSSACYTYSARSLKPTPQSILNNFFSFQFFSKISPVSISARDTFKTDEFLD